MGDPTSPETAAGPEQAKLGTIESMFSAFASDLTSQQASLGFNGPAEITSSTPLLKGWSSSHTEKKLGKKPILALGDM